MFVIFLFYIVLRCYLIEFAIKMLSYIWHK